MNDSNKQQELVQFQTQNWNTNWNKSLISFNEIVPAKQRDAIPSIDDPQFVRISTARNYLSDLSPVIVVVIGNEARAYPLDILMWHEIVNDTIKNNPIAVSYCPLCSSEFVYSRVVNGNTLDFGTSGLLRNSNLIMYDRQSESLWQQFNGQAIVGDYVNNSLTPIPANVVSFKDFYTTYPTGIVLSRNTGYLRNYGTNPYVNYDNLTNQPMFFKGITDKKLPAMQRILGIEFNNVSKAYPLVSLQKNPIIYDKINDNEYVIFSLCCMKSALNKSNINEGKNIYMTGVFSPYVNGQRLNFILNQFGEIIDTFTNSSWSILGKALSGPLSGIQLTPINHGDVFWFAWAAFYPNTIIMNV